jgi:Protein of unknown function (DUF3563)
MHKAHGCRSKRALVVSGNSPYIVHSNIRKTTMFKPLKQIARALRAPTVQEREMAYLNASSDAIELEYRMRQIDRGMFRKGF